MSGLEASSLQALGEQWQEAWIAGKAEAFERCCTPDVHYEDPLTAEPLHGSTELAAHASRLREAFPDLEIDRIGELLGGGSQACLPWLAKGTHRGELPSLPPTDRELVVHGIHYADLADGRIRRVRGFFDLYDVSVQLGVLPRRGSLSETALLLVRGFGLRR